MEKLTKKEIHHASGKRKRAIARATIRPGTGKVKVNNMSLDTYSSKILRMKIREPLLLAKPLGDKLDIFVRTSGGGVVSQAEAARLAIARALMSHTSSLKQTFLEYDRHLIVADTRRKEPCKPNDSKARAKRQKSYR
ncbi:MAG: 30S ribosomal protein S9 [archaeon]